ncbi:hypothetical protein MMC17_000989 [Xylographa soralifera]|nr:hypothetical protein [Xylographa soralifera]
MASCNPSALNGVSSVNSTTLVTGNAVTSSTSVAPKDSFAFKAKQASSAWRSFEDAWKNISEHSPVFLQIAEAMDRHNTMQDATQKKDKNIAELKSTIQIQMDQHEIRYTKWRQEKSQLEQRAINLKTDLSTHANGLLKDQKATHIQEVKKLTKELEAERKAVATLKEELEKARTRTGRVEEELSCYAKQLSEWEGYLSLLKDIDLKKLEIDVKQLFTRCRRIAHNHFLRELPDQLFTDSRWENLPRSLEIPLDFPPSNSPAAKHVRMAACLHVLARRLSYDFFKPCYIPESPMFGEGIQEILNQQLLTDVGKERVTRALLLSTYGPEEVNAAIEQAVDATSREVLELLSPIGGNEAFRKDVEALFREAAGVWKEVQRSRKAVEVSMIDDFKNVWQWSHLDDFTVVEIKGQPGPPKFDMLNLFPRMFIPEDQHIVNSGYVLWPHQNTAFAAEQELRECMLMKRSRGGWMGNVPGGSMRRERRLSTRSDGRNGAIGSSPVSPKTEDKGPFLGPQRGSKQGTPIQNGHRGE